MNLLQNVGNLKLTEEQVEEYWEDIQTLWNSYYANSYQTSVEYDEEYELLSFYDEQDSGVSNFERLVEDLNLQEFVA